NYWDPAQMHAETAIGEALVKAAREVGVHHLIWSTLPDCERLSGGRLNVPHFTGKARVDAAVQAAGFPRHTFVQAAMYYQNFITRMCPEALPSGGGGLGGAGGSAPRGGSPRGRPPSAGAVRPPRA